MDQAPHQSGSSFCYSNYNFDGYPTEVHDAQSGFFEDAIGHGGDAGIVDEANDSADQHYGHANDFNQSHMANISAESQRTVTRFPQCSDHTSQFACRNDNDIRRGLRNPMAISSPGCQNHDIRRDPRYAQDSSSDPFNMLRRTMSVSNSPLAPMEPSACPSSPHSCALLQSAEGTSKYGSFQNRFNSSTTAKNFRHSSMRFERVPWKAPEEDPTIPEVEGNRSRHVERIYNAMVRGDVARDNEGSTAMKRWVYDANYPSALVEAYAHKVFDAMLEQVKLGFRGWNQNDYVIDERKGEDDDRDVDCAGRLDNIIAALEHEKSICENVMSSSNQIRMFVNAPKAYSKRKDQNRVGNGKRPNVKGFVSGRSDLPPTKKRRTVGRNVRHGSSTRSDLPNSRGNTPHESHGTNKLPYYMTSKAAHCAAASPSTSNFLAPPAPAMHRQGAHTPSASFGHHGSDLKPQTTASTSTSTHTQQITAAVPSLRSPFTSPLTLPQSYFSPPTVPTPSAAHHWPQTNMFHDPLRSDMDFQPPAGDYLFNGTGDWTQQPPLFEPNTLTANFFDQQPEACQSKANVEEFPSTQASDTDRNDAPSFISFWQQQDGVQPFSFDAL